MDRFETGWLYEVTYVLQSGNYQWYQWKMTAVYVACNRDHDYLTFSLRPLAGSTEIATKCIQDSRRIKRVGAREATPTDVKLPKRLPGSVPGPSAVNIRQVLAD
jgi:hypothetical protein